MKPGEFLSALRNDFEECLSRSCKKKGCTLGVASLPTKVIIDGDKYKIRHKFGGKLCDYLLFCDGGGIIVAAVELKGGRLDVYTALEQVRNGSQVAEQMAKSQPVKDFFPIVLKGRRTRAMETRLFRPEKNRVSFRRKSYKVILGQCGDEFREIVAQHSFRPAHSS